ncbi:MAG: TonB-dependent receptor [Desulfuromonadales bacterium]
MYRSVMLVLLGLLVGGPAIAEEADLSAAVMDEVVVTATRQKEEIYRVPANVTIVTAEQIAQSPANTVPELLRNIAGVLVNDITGNGRNYTVDLRGFGETASLNTLVLIDGRRINQADLSGVDWSLVPKSRVERIEIVRGGRGSVLYGDNATGGVINIITKQGGREMTVAAGLAGGSYDTYAGEAAVSGSTGAARFAVDGAYRESDGYRDNSDTEVQDFGLSLDYDLSDRVFAKLKAGFHDDETSLPGALLQSELDSGVSRRDSLHPDDYADTQDWYLQGGLQLYVNDDSYLEVDVAWRERDAEFFSFFDAGEYEGDTELETLTIAPKLVFNEEVLGYATRLLLGFDFEDSEEDLDNKSIFFGFPSTSSYELSRTSYGVYAHLDTALTEHFSVSGGARSDQADFDFKSRDDGTSDSVDLDEDLYTLGLNYTLAGGYSLYASYAKSFRYPVLDEMYNFFNNSVNSDLGSQTSDDFEVGVRYRGASGLSLTVNFFYVETEDEIYLDPALFANLNLDGDTIRQGVELAASKELHGLFLSGSYTYRDTEIDGGQYDGNELPNVPEHQASLAAQAPLFENLRLGLTGTYVGERRFISDFANAEDKQDDYFLLSGRLSYLMPHGTAYLVVNNILDEEYEEYGALNYLGEKGYYPSPEINFMAGVDFRF